MTHQKTTTLRVISSTTPEAGAASVEIYRPFFLAGILTVLTAGCSLGAIALLGLATRQSYITSAWTPYVLAHANSQLYGWVGFFIMGFALQMHPPRKDRAQLFHQLAYWSLGLMGAGIVVRFVAEPLAAAHGGTWTGVGVVSALLQLAAVLVFNFNATYTRHDDGQRLNWQTSFVFASLFWMVAIAIAEPFAFALSHQAGQEESVLFVAQWMTPLREAQFLGFVGNMIFGVALIKLHTCFGFREALKPYGIAAFFVWNVGILLRMFGWVGYFRSMMSPEASGMYLIGGIAIATGAVLAVISGRIFEPTSHVVPSRKFIRGAFAWLLIAGVLLLLEPVHLRQIQAPFSHAYIGAVRHALTVGFISQMILGVGTHVISRMNDIPDSLQKSFLATFILVNLGNAGRVGLQIATDYTPRAFAPMGATGFIELCGLFLWGYAMVSILLRSRLALRRHGRLAGQRS